MEYDTDFTVRVGKLHGDAFSIIKKNYGKILLAVFLVMVLSTIASSIVVPFVFGMQFITYFSLESGFLPQVMEDANVWHFMAIIIPVMLISMALGLFIQAVVEPLRGGQRLYMLDVIAGRSVSVERLFHPFKRFLRFVGCYLWIYLWTFLWSLLFIVPGIIKFISYSMTPYLVAQYDNISIREAMDISKRITNGYKGQIFLMYLIVFGWSLLSVFCGFLMCFGQILIYAYAILWLLPLIAVFEAVMYNKIKSIAFARGTLNADDLKIFVAQEAKPEL